MPENLTPRELEIAHLFGHDLPGYVTGDLPLPIPGDAINEGCLRQHLKRMLADIVSLRTLLAEQAKRADAAERKAQAHEIDAAAHLRHYHAAQAQAAEMRRALVDARSTLDHDRTGIIAPWINRTIDSIDDALALSPGEALERVRREAGARALDSAAQYLMADFDKSRPVLPSEIAQDLLAGAAELRKGGE